MFQVEGSDQPVMRTSALIALICALWSLTFGCMYILRFSTMKSMHKASRWAEVCIIITIDVEFILTLEYRKLKSTPPASGGTFGYSSPFHPFSLPGLSSLSASPSFHSPGQVAQLHYLLPFLTRPQLARASASLLCSLSACATFTV